MQKPLKRTLTRLRTALIVITITAALSCNGGRAKQEAPKDVPVVDSGSNPEKGVDLRLGVARAVEGTDAIRLDLYHRYDGGSFSKVGGETRNVLFLERGEKAARWLLPDNDHRVVELSDLMDEKDGNQRRVLASVAIVMPAVDNALTGRLLVFDPWGKNIVTVAENVRRVDLSRVMAGEVLLVYEQDRKLMQVAYDPKSLAKLRELEIDVPKLKAPTMR